VETRTKRRAVLEVAAGVVIAFVIASVWGLVAAQLWGHRGNNGPLTMSLALSWIAPALCLPLLWRTRPRVAYGFVGYIAFHFLFILGALTVFHRS